MCFLFRTVIVLLPTYLPFAFNHTAIPCDRCSPAANALVNGVSRAHNKHERKKKQQPTLDTTRRKIRLLTDVCARHLIFPPKLKLPTDVQWGAALIYNL